MYGTHPILRTPLEEGKLRKGVSVRETRRRSNVFAPHGLRVATTVRDME